MKSKAVNMIGLILMLIFFSGYANTYADTSSIHYYTVSQKGNDNNAGTSVDSPLGQSLEVTK